MVRQTLSGADRQANGVDKNASGYIGNGPEYTMQFEIKDVVNLAVETVVFNDASSRTVNGMILPGIKMT